MNRLEVSSKVTSKEDLIRCVKDMYAASLTTSVSGNHSIRTRAWMWITPSGIPRYFMVPSDLVKVNIRSGISVGRRRPSIEVGMHRIVYSLCPNIQAIIHTHSPYTIAVAISSKFKHVIEEAKIVVGTPSIIANAPSGSDKLARAVGEAFRTGARAVVIRNHGVIAGGSDIHHARAIVESLEEWAKILTISKAFGGVRKFLSD